jgi:hypothetical protein
MIRRSDPCGDGTVVGRRDIAENGAEVLATVGGRRNSDSGADRARAETSKARAAVTDAPGHPKHLRSQPERLNTAAKTGPAVPGTRYRLDVVAPTVLDVVQSAGGWLFDKRMAGWDVTVAVCEPGDFRPLQILGVDALELTSVPLHERPSPQDLAVAAGLFHDDELARHSVFQAFEQGLAEVTLWGEPWPEELHRSNGQVRRRISSAARVFKSHALAAAHGRLVAAVADVEIFQCGTVGGALALRPELRRQVANYQ